MNYREIQVINQNPFIGGKLIAHFLSGCENNSIDYLAVYLLFPLLYKSESRIVLSKANKNSTLDTIFLSKDKSMLAGLEKRFYYFEKLTKHSIIVSSVHFGVTVSNQLAVKEPIIYSKEKNVSLKEFYRASFQLGQILSKTDIGISFIKLGIRYV